MQWNELTCTINVLSSGGKGNPHITDVVYDSRRVQPGALYVAIPGFSLHGDTYIPQAIQNGAAGIISENACSDCGVPWAQVASSREVLGQLGRTLWKIDLDQMTTIAVTGTNGKTTTAHLFTTLCKQLYGPDAAWMFGTIGNILGESKQAAKNTTPEASDVFGLIGKAAKRPRAVVMEVSSHALALKRVAGLLFDVAVFTNLTQDHLDYHHTMEEYYAAKKLLFTTYLKADGCAVINNDDPWGQRLAAELSGVRVVTFGRSETADVRMVGGECTWEGTAIEVVHNEFHTTFTSKLTGVFTMYNMAALCAGACAMDIDSEMVQQCFDTMTTVTGRMDKIDLPTDYTVVVDYAHTPDALENVLKTARSLTARRVICVFGCGGDRDKSKRSIMGSIVAAHCDEAVVTSDNPRTEKPQAILQQIVAGIPMDFPHMVIADRKEAIAKALRSAQNGDCVVIAGKGHEDYQEINGIKYPFNDKDVVVEMFEKNFGEMTHA